MEVIKVENLYKQYRLGQVSTGSIAHDLNRWWHTVRGKEDPYEKVTGINNREEADSSEYVWALEDINFSVKQGEVLGIIGKNGAGKSTLLKILSKVTSPTKGNIKVKGRIASLLEVGTGFHPELTGRENIFLNGAILGMTKTEIRSKFDEIVAFSGVEKYIDTPVKRYSSGMYVRLAFAVAAHLEPEILIVDEVLAVGDAEFQEKCLGKMKDVNADGRTVLFVSHNLTAIQKICKTGVFLENGKLQNSGKINEIIDLYRFSKKEKSSIYISPIKTDNKEVSFNQIQVINKDRKLCNQFYCNEEIFIDFTFNIPVFSVKYNVFVTIKDNDGHPVFSAENLLDQTKMTLVIKPNFLTRGNYSIETFIHLPALFQLESLDDICHFSVIDVSSPFVIHGNHNYGNVFGNYEWLNVYE